MMNNRHAYVIMAHSDFDQLILLCKCLDDNRNDIYIHLDEKFIVSDDKISELKEIIKHSQLYFADRRNLSWGAFSLVECEVKLLDCVLRNGDYLYIHLLSGADLPIKSQNYIHSFFEAHSGEEFIDFKGNQWLKEVKRKLKVYYPLQEMIGKIRNRKIREGLYTVQKVIVRIQEIAGVDRLKPSGVNIQGGSQWFSITSGCARYIVNHASQYSQMFKMTSCSDEFLVQTIVKESPYFEHVHESQEEDGCHKNMRLIIWERGMHPRTLTRDNLELIEKTDLLFARKFDIRYDKEFLLEIVNRVQNSN